MDLSITSVNKLQTFSDTSKSIQNRLYSISDEIFNLIEGLPWDVLSEEDIYNMAKTYTESLRKSGNEFGAYKEFFEEAYSLYADFLSRHRADISVISSSDVTVNSKPTEPTSNQGTEQNWFQKTTKFLGGIWDGFWNGAGKVSGKIAEYSVLVAPGIIAGGSWLFMRGLSGVVGFVNPNAGANIQEIGDAFSKNVYNTGKTSAAFTGDVIYGAIAGDSIKNPNAAMVTGMVGLGFVPIAGQIADIRDVIGGVASGDKVRLGFATVAFIPGIGDVAKHADEGIDIAKNLAKNSDEIADAAKNLAKNSDEVADVAKNIAKNSDEAADVAKSAGSKLVNGTKMTTDEALDAATDFLGEGYKDMGGGRFVSADGTRQVRMTDADLAPVNNHAGAVHMNFETLAPNTNKSGKMQIIDNKHIFLED